MHHARNATSQALVEVRLHGHLRARFGKSYHLAVGSAAEAVRALCLQVKGFRESLSKGAYRVWIGDAPITDASNEIFYPPGKMVRIVPVATGSKSGFGQIVFGAVLIAASFYLPGAGLALTAGQFTASSIAFSIGVSMALGGVAQLLAGNPVAPTSGSTERPENQPSYAFNGAINTTAQGNPVPILYGRMIVGSQVISTGLSVAQLT